MYDIYQRSPLNDFRSIEQEDDLLLRRIIDPALQFPIRGTRFDIQLPTGNAWVVPIGPTTVRRGPQPLKDFCRVTAHWAVDRPSLERSIFRLHPVPPPH